MSRASPAIEQPFLELQFTPQSAVATRLANELIEQLVRSGNYQPGSRLPSERQLALSLGVGRSAVREALKSLSLLGLVETRQGYGTILKSAASDLLPNVVDWALLLAEDRLRDLVEARLHIEVAAARLAARRRTAEEAEHLATQVTDLEGETDRSAVVAGVVGFHLMVAETSHNSVLVGIVRSLHSLLEAWTARAIEDSAGVWPGHEEHRAVLRAIAAGDADAAGKAMEDHLVRASERLAAATGGDWDLAI